MRNNGKALLFHISFSFFCLLVIVILTISSPHIGNTIALWPVRIGMATLIPISYIGLGSWLKPDDKKGNDFLTGGFIAVIGMGLVLISMRHTLNGFWSMPSEEELTYYWQAPNLFLLPTTLTCFFLEIVRTPLMMLGSSLLPSFLMGIGLRWKRNQMKKCN